MILAIFCTIIVKDKMEVLDITTKVKTNLVKMVLGEVTCVEQQLRLFMNPELRKTNNTTRTVHKNGVKRCPQVNHFTGAMSMFMNIDILKFSTQPEVLGKFAEAYKCEVPELAMTYGPPSILIKPDGAGMSSPFVYRFGADKDTITYTGLVSFTSHSDEILTGSVQKLTHFETYYDILSSYYNFEEHSSDNSILYLEKWFSVEGANKVLEGYTNLYNHHVRKEGKLDKSIPKDVQELFKRLQVTVPERFESMSWVDVDMPIGEFKLFSSREVIRTTSCKDKDCARMYVQIPIQMKSETWDVGSMCKELTSSYISGRFGDWSKPGKRCYLRENKTEQTSMKHEEIEEVWRYVSENKDIFGVKTSARL